MRKIVPVLLIVLLVPIGYYMASKGGGSNGVQDLPSGEGIALKLDKSSYTPSDVMVLTLLNNADTNATTSYHFKLYRLEGGEWKEVPVNLMFIEIAVVIEPGKSWEQKVKLSDLGLTPGHYKIVKEVYLGGTTVKAGAEFDING
ncbi:immunoglobulin-like domain-containing protein [Thermococcus thioreducens]|uniref:Bacterial Ig-like domain-containing protein n=1 Tax=Thermococcus thioreducens TaxID=277988 RepID=A0A0Q2MRQ7_9EURY|nr:immunoglobulin-like domain-containing protein [Thermococcus thioreducens]ASJ12623.1 hypothetical protein A3L14_06855 [Thermococcus thioreducens]KQH82383.1 hypothetical protein AMR53_05385 [Thermococcus thioreducens]SEV87718.1 hypothetical protein SAMN05216170_0577 [Thermococcus thioreducens]